MAHKLGPKIIKTMRMQLKEESEGDWVGFPLCHSDISFISLHFASSSIDSGACASFPASTKTKTIWFPVASSHSQIFLMNLHIFFPDWTTFLWWWTCLRTDSKCHSTIDFANKFIDTASSQSIANDEGIFFHLQHTDYSLSGNAQIRLMSLVESTRIHLPIFPLN